MEYKGIEQFEIKHQNNVSEQNEVNEQNNFEKLSELENNLSMEVPESKFRIYAIANILSNMYFQKEDKLNKYIKHNKKYVGEKIIIDYLGHMAGRVDVIRVTYSDNSVKYFSEENDLGYMIYNRMKSILTGKHVWDYEYGTLKDIYDELKKHGVVLENDVYGRQDELYSSVSDGFIEPLKRK